MPGPQQQAAAGGGGGNGTRRVQNRGPGRRNLVRNRFRASTFRRFLLDKFGAESLGKGSGVLDVAGGKGELSFELVNLNRIQSTVVDPRPLQLGKFEKYMRKGIYHRNEMFRKYIVQSVDEAQEGETQLPSHLRMCLDLPMVQIAKQSRHRLIVCQDGAHLDDNGCDSTSDDTDLSSSDRLAASAASAMQAAARLKWTNKGLTSGGHEQGSEAMAMESAAYDPSSESDSDISSVAETENGERWEGCCIADPEAAADTILNCSAVVGMHPDQATEPIVDLALALGVPFAVVPCCVYSSHFPWRKDASGEPVRSYAQFVEYLLAKSPMVQCEELPFEGCNKVVFGPGASSPLATKHQAAGAGAYDE